MSARPVLVWYRNDLRVSDHAPLRDALASGQPVAALHVTDARLFEMTPYGFVRCGAYRHAFLRECLAELRLQLEALGVTFIERQGCTAEVVPAVIREINASTVYAHRMPGTEESDDAAAIMQALRADGVSAKGYPLQTLISAGAVKTVPEVFTQFRTLVERHGLDVPEAVAAPHVASPPVIPDMHGGSTAAWRRLRAWMWDADRLRNYKETRNGMLNPDDSSKLSPWLAHGCISAREIYAEVRRYERERVKNQSTYWLIFELLWRDYFQLIAHKHGAALFRSGGLQKQKLPWRRDETLFSRWCAGQTGFPLVDANMRELAATGFMSNRGRQNVGSFLTKNLGLDWRMGAAYFEHMLIDYDVASNWGNWNYVAGVGNDARGFRFFNIHKQSQDYDANGDYVRHWLPELKDIRGARVHRPELLSGEEQRRAGVIIGKNYPAPIVDLFKSAHENEEIFLRATR